MEMNDEEIMGVEHRYARLDLPRGFPTVSQVVGVWKEKFEKGVLNDTHFMEHWRLYVPQVLSRDPSVNCLDNAFDEENVQNILFAPLEEFICNGNPNEVFERIKRLDEPPSVCGRVFKMSEPTYNCRECGTDPTCVLCVDCFKKSEHRNHKYKMATSNGGGCCDCGDTEAWKSHAYCSIHVVGILEGASKSSQFPDDMRERTRITFRAALQYAYQLLSIDHEPKLPAYLRLKEVEDDPLTFIAASDTYCTVLYNDETHTFEHVINTLTKVIKCSQKDAIDFVTNIDREGRAVVKCSTFQHCTELKSEVEHFTGRNALRPLKVQVKHSHVIAHQLYAIKLLEWFQNILSYSKHFREIFAEVIQEKKQPPEVSILKGILLRDSMLWKSARVHWHRLFISGMFKEYENKKAFAKVFTENYGSIMKDFTRDDHDHSVSVVSLAVQIYTVRTIAHYLIEKEDVIFVLLNTFWSECGSYIKDGKLEFQRNEHSTGIVFKRAQFIIYDLHYVLSSVPDEWTEGLQKGFQQGFLLFLKLLSSMQGMDSITRQVGQHMEYEPEWETAFNLHIKLSTVITSMLKWCGTNRNVLVRSYRATLRKLYESPCPLLNEPNVVREIADHSAACINYDVSEKPVSIHLPLSRFLAGLHVQLEKYGLHFYSPEFNLDTKLTLEQIIEPVLRTQVMIAQVHAGLWRRNGYSILHQIYFYHNVKCRNEMLNRDIILLQFGASLIESNDFLIHLLNKFKLMEWADLEFENLLKRGEEDSLRQTITLVEEFLALLITILSERYVVGVGKVSEKDCIKKEIIQQLCIKPMSHSELSKALPDTENHDTNIDSIIEEIATFQKPTTGSGKGLYKLKPEYYDQYNVFFYHYTKEEFSKSEEAQRRRRREEGLLDCCPPPPLPPLTESFSMLVNLLQCDVMFYLIQLILKRACDLNARTFSESQLHRVLHLIGYALHEEDNHHCEYFMYTERSEKWNILKLLEELHKNSRVEAYRDLIKWTINKFRQVSSATSKIRTKASAESAEQMEVEESCVLTATADEDDMNEDYVKKEKERIAKLAAERRQKIMAQMSSAQKSFMKENASLYEAATAADRARADEMAWKALENVEFPVAVGRDQTPHTCTDPSYTCILCQEQQVIRTDAPAMVFGAFIQKSSVLKNEYSAPPKCNEAIQLYFLPSTLRPSPFVSTCGHVMHCFCWERYFSNILTKENRRTYRLRQPISFDIEKNEFLCPLCESLNNAVLPVLPPLTKIIGNSERVVEEQLSFHVWLTSVREVTDRKVQEIEKRRTKEAKNDQMDIVGIEGTTNSVYSATGEPSVDTLTQKIQFGTPTKNVMAPSSFSVISSKTAVKSTTAESSNDVLEILLLTNPGANTAMNVIRTPVISETINLMMNKFAKSIYTKGMNGAVEDENISVLYCWKSCAYTIHVVETILRDENRSLLGDLPTRQKKCIKALIRFSSMQNIKKSELVVNSYALMLLSLVFDKNPTRKNSCILDWDPFGMLVALVMSLPSLFFLQSPPPIPSGSILDLYATHLMLVATVAQILIGVELPFEVETESSFSGYADDASCLRAYLRLLGKSNHDKVDVGALWKRITELASPFLRCACIFFRYLTGVHPPECLKQVSGDTYENMCKYLGLPTTCEGLLGSLAVWEVFQTWLSNWQAQQLELGKELKLSSYLEYKGLISLPKDYSELINTVSLFTCPNSDHEDSRNPTLCLVCGIMLCSQSYCCQKELDGALVSNSVDFFVVVFVLHEIIFGNI